MRAGGRGRTPQSESSAGTHAPRPRNRPHIESPGQGTSLRNGGRRLLPRRQQEKWYIPEVTSRSPSAASDTYRKWRTEAGASRDCGGRGDPGAAATMGRAFGNLTRVRHVITYSLSPFEQRAFPHYFTKGIPNVLRRIQASILRSAPRECPGRVGAGLPSPGLTAGPSSSACCRAGALRLAIHTFSH